ncbi:hypothetical protein CG723_28250 [Streptomyces sp. CB01635]|uniref:WD40 repeat domain-containing protein n=1 Tax=unclassified Streptomyces TaxID=2593676 RepID=UPI000C27C484|nr:hypothetical protein [Streptomyces sp. CB01635]PJN08295.1 hypothetical protein CG723_28250 [Streptomyces sp. CB01635]
MRPPQVRRDPDSVQAPTCAASRQWAGDLPGLGTPLKGHLLTIDTLSYSPDGHTSAGGSGDGTVRLWGSTDPRNAAPVGPSKAGHTDAVASLTSSQDGPTLASGSNGNMVRLRDAAGPSNASLIGQSLSPSAKTGNFLSFSPRSRMRSTTQDGLTRERRHDYLPRLSHDPPCKE